MLVSLSLVESPNVTAAMFGIDVNFLNVKVNEGGAVSNRHVDRQRSENLGNRPSRKFGNSTHSRWPR